MLHHLRLWPFVLGFTLGIIGILYVRPDQNVQYRYPVPDQAKDLVYKDRNGLCFQYLPKEVDCDANESKLKSFPLSV
jgi:hypothetical protein